MIFSAKKVAKNFKQLRCIISLNCSQQTIVRMAKIRLIWSPCSSLWSAFQEYIFASNRIVSVSRQPSLAKSQKFDYRMAQANNQGLYSEAGTQFYDLIYNCNANIYVQH
jgi:hypothetical protein